MDRTVVDIVTERLAMLLDRSPAVQLLRGFSGIKVTVVPSLNFIARSTRANDGSYGVTLSVGIWLALAFILRQEVSSYESNPEPLGSRISEVAWFDEDGTMRTSKIGDLTLRPYWNWLDAAPKPAEPELSRFIADYVDPQLEDRPFDRRIELGVAFVALHELNHILFDHFRKEIPKEYAKKIELLADLRAACTFPEMINQCSVEFGIGGIKRCNQMIASGFSIGCAVLCFQILNTSGTHSRTHPNPSARIYSLMMHLANNALPRIVQDCDREQLIAGLCVLIESFGATELLKLCAEDIESIRGLDEADTYFCNNKSSFVQKMLSESI